MATYLLHGLSSTSAPISSSQGMAGQPTLNWPSTTSEKPTIQTEGIRFGDGQYLEFSSHFDNQGSDKISVVVWVYRYGNGPGGFLTIGNNFTNGSHPQGIGDLSLYLHKVTINGNDRRRVRPHVNGVEVNGIQRMMKNNGWTLFGVGWEPNQGYLKRRISFPGYGSLDNEAHTVSSWNTGGTYFIGCLDSGCTTGTDMLIHSIRVYNDLSPVESRSLDDIPNNDYFPCGNGVSDTNDDGSYTEECDDGDWTNGNGCSEYCKVEDGWKCQAGTCSVFCRGNSAPPDQTTTCYDNNIDNGDGCSSICAVETGYVCEWNSTDKNSYCKDECGDGKVVGTMAATYCDDGNTDGGDGCDSTCTKETDWTCSGGSPTTPDTCTDTCGDGKVVNPTAGYCDDGAKANGDGCSSTCTVEAGWECTLGDSLTASSCNDICGDGKVTDPTSGYCDDGDKDSGDGCSSTCQVESGWSCTLGDSSTSSVCTEECGDGTVLNPIAGKCDDGNKLDNDGCSSSCAVETGWKCTLRDSSTASTCSDSCGDGKVMDPTTGYCDDGNSDETDGCTSACSVIGGWDCTLGDSSTASSCTDTCGDGKVMKPTSGYCDDGNKADADGCSSSCSVESGWTCTLGDSSTASSCSDICGDGAVMNPTAGYCDDGDKDDGEGCSSNCSVESGWDCTLGDSSTASSCSDKCGDGKVVTPTTSYCDDGNKIDGDGCSSTCAIEIGWECTLGDFSTSSSCSQICGDGKIMASSTGYCDDGNKIDGDGCDSSCSIESGWECTGGTSSTPDTCSDFCGDSKVVKSQSNYCDDGNKDNSDGCDNTCSVEVGWTCTSGDFSTKSECSDQCNDGVVMKPQTGYCDDGNKIDGDGCNVSCGVETGWNCTLGDAGTASSCTDYCGDGIVVETKSNWCDDGNSVDGDGCSSSCQIETGWNCTGGDLTTPSSCIDYCGDSKVMDPKPTYCDDGGTTFGDGCDNQCQVEAGWTCTLGGPSTQSYCSDVCGDGIVVTSSSGYCDDGNTVDEDGCNSSCQIEPNVICTSGDSTTASVCTDTCGDGFVSLSNLTDTYCDDGNNIGGDGCSSSCVVESNYVCKGGNSTSKSVCTTCSLDNCSECMSEDTSKCEICDEGYELDNKFQCIEASTEVPTSASASSQAAVGGVIAAAAVNSALNMSSPAAIWAMANQLQLLLLLLLTKCSMPDKIIQFITGNRFASFSLDFLPLDSLPVISIPKGWLLKDQNIESLTEIGIESGSSFNNNFSLIFLIFLLVPPHICVCLLPKCNKLKHSESKCKSRFGKCYCTTREILYELFNFTIYFRLLLEAYQFIMLACVSEIYNMEYTEYASFSISCVFLVICIFILALSMYVYCSFKNYDDKKHYHCKEFVRGLKNTQNARSYTFMILLRRFVLVIWLICMRDFGKYFLIPFMSVYQLLYVIRLAWSRPFENICDNLVEIINELFFTVACCSLCYLNTDSAWEGMGTELYMYLLMSNNFVIVSIMFANTIRSFATKCKKKCSKSTKTSQKPQPPKPLTIKPPQNNTPNTPDPKEDSMSISKPSSTLALKYPNFQTRERKSSYMFKITKTPHQSKIFV
ncbi:unnamed protein product [Moneuplotes crassus]|uniref:Uncharacterized protein n=1 Tax=Euplotes crassus TaxID=5936 RepID=A0AAD1Y4W9_EUPCR|nr:unnamed protein product [Moneuplotes crassus]